MGGHGLYATVRLLPFMNMWLNDGAGPHDRVLSRRP